MVSPVSASVNATPEAIAAVRARLVAEAAAQEEQRPPAVRLCPTVRRLLEGRRKVSPRA